MKYDAKFKLVPCTSQQQILKYNFFQCLKMIKRSCTLKLWSAPVQLKKKTKKILALAPNGQSITSQLYQNFIKQGIFILCQESATVVTFTVKYFYRFSQEKSVFKGSYEELINNTTFTPYYYIIVLSLIYYNIIIVINNITSDRSFISTMEVSLIEPQYQVQGFLVEIFSVDLINLNGFIIAL